MFFIFWIFLEFIDRPVIKKSSINKRAEKGKLKVKANTEARADANLKLRWEAQEKRSRYNRVQPELTMIATVVEKNNQKNSILFELENGDRILCSTSHQITHEEYLLIHIGDRGKLKLKGDWFRGFTKIP